MLRKRSFALIFALLALTFACSDWEKTTYQTLATSKAVIDQAGRDYNAGLLPQTAAARNAIEHARAIQTTAVRSFEAYAVAKVTGDPAASLDQKRQAIVTAIITVNQVVIDVQALYKEVKK